MNYTVELSNTAEQDINESVRYVTLQLKNPIAGRRLLGNTIDCVDSLESFPARFPVIDDPILVIHQIHFFCFTRFMNPPILLWFFGSSMAKAIGLPS